VPAASSGGHGKKRRQIGKTHPTCAQAQAQYRLQRKRRSNGPIVAVSANQPLDVSLSCISAMPSISVVPQRRVFPIWRSVCRHPAKNNVNTMRRLLYDGLCRTRCPGQELGQRAIRDFPRRSSNAWPKQRETGVLRHPRFFCAHTTTARSLCFQLVNEPVGFQRRSRGRRRQLSPRLPQFPAILVEINFLLVSYQLPLDQHNQHRAAGPSTNTSCRSVGSNPLPLVAKLCEKVHDLSG
jgi:hypothetical protein